MYLYIVHCPAHCSPRAWHDPPNGKEYDFKSASVTQPHSCNRSKHVICSCPHTSKLVLIVTAVVVLVYWLSVLLGSISQL